MRDMTMRQGMWPPSRRVVSRGLSLRTCSTARQLQRSSAVHCSRPNLNNKERNTRPERYWREGKLLTVWPPTTTASDLDRVSKTCCRDSGLLIQAACPIDVAILPSSVIAYFRMPKGLCSTARCSSAYVQCGASQLWGGSCPHHS